MKMSSVKFEIIDVTKDNVDEIGMFCVKSKRNSEGYQAKLGWIKKRFDEGLKYKMLLVDEGRKDLTSRGFIEYMPSENAWRGINVENYMIIHCLWVVGKWKKHGFGKKLVEECIKDSKSIGKDGVAVLTSNKPFLTNGAFYKKQGFKLIEKDDPYYEIYALSFDDSKPNPTFHEKEYNYEDDSGLRILESDQCPYNVGTRNVFLDVAEDLQLQIVETKITSSDEANHLPSPYGTFNVLKEGTHFTHYYMKASKLKELLK